MLSVNVLGTTTEEAEGDGSLDVLVAVNRRSYGAYDSTPDLLAIEEDSERAKGSNISKLHTRDTNSTRVIH